MPQSDDQVRLDIMFLLHKRLSDNPASPGVDRAIIQDTLKIAEKQMDNNMAYLEEKALVALTRGRTSQWIFAKLTAEGIEVIEHLESYADKFPFIQNATGHIYEGAHENAIQAAPTQVSFNEKMADAFKQASDQVFMANLSHGDREKIIKQLKALQKELQRADKADLGTIQTDWEWLRKNAGMTIPAIASVVVEAIKVILGLP